MKRAAALPVLLVLLSALLLPGPVAGQEDAPTKAQIEKAVTDLGSGEQELRQKAIQVLRQAGAHAIRPLEDAAWGDDAEKAFWASRVLRMVELGVGPDTPEDVVKLAEGFREEGNETIRPVILQRLAARGKAGLAAVRAIVLSEREDDVRGRVFAEVARDALPDVGTMVLEGRLDEAESILWIGAGTGADGAMFNLAAFLLTTGRLDAAVAYTRPWAEALSTPLRASILSALERAAGEPEKALTAAKKSGQDYLVHLLFMEQGRWADFADAFAAQTAGRVNVGSLGVLLSAQRLAGRDDAADSTLQSLVNVAKRDEDSVLPAVSALMFNGHPDEAVELLTVQGEYGLAIEILTNQGKGDEAKELARKWLDELATNRGDRAPEPENDELSGALQAELQYAELLLDMGRDEEAAEVLKAASGTVAADVPWMQLAAMARLERLAGMETVARERVLKVIGQGLEPFQEDWALTGLLPRRRLDLSALWRSLRAMDAAATEADTLKQLERLARDQVDEEELRKLVDRVVAFAQERPQDWSQGWLAAWAQYAYQRAMHATRVRLLEAEHDLFGGAPVLAATGQALIELGESKRAGELLAEAYEAGAMSPQVLALQGLAMERSGDVDGASKLRNAANVSALGAFDARVRLGEMFERYGMAQAADEQRAFAASVCSLFSRMESPDVDLYAEYLREAGELDRAERAVTLSAMGVMGATGAYAAETLTAAYEYRDIYRALRLLDAGRKDEAVEVARQVFGRSPGLADCLFLLIEAFDRNGLRDVADDLFEQCWKAHEVRLEIFPGQASRFNTIAWVGSRCGRRLEESLAHSKKSLEMEPYSPYYLDTLADVEFMSGNVQRAVELEWLSVAIEPSAFTWRQYHRFLDAAE